MPTAQNYRLIGPMMRDVARLNFEGKLQAVAEEEGILTSGMRSCSMALSTTAPPKAILNPSDAP